MPPPLRPVTPRVATRRPAVWLVACALLAGGVTLPAAAQQAALPPVVEDARLAAAVERARARFLARQAFDRFDVTVLAAHGDGTWRRGAHGGNVLAYPASCVKLAYLVGAVHWCTAQGRAPDCLDADVRPMIVESDNVATGRVVDAISGAPNVVPAPAADGAASPAGGTAEAAPAGFAEWLERRRYTERLLDAYGLRGGMRVLNKTWPTNSGEEPVGFEQVSIARVGRNAMSPDASARLLLALVSGAIEPQASAYVRALLARDRWGGHGTFGRGLPPGTAYLAKTGNAYDTQEEIAWFRLPDGREFVIAAFSNSWDQSQPLPHDVGHFGDFVEELLAALPASDARRPRSEPSSVAALPWSTRLAAHDARARGTWFDERLAGAYGRPSVRATTDPAATLEWRVRVPRAGRYELAVRYPPRAGATTAAAWEIEAGDGTRTVVRYDQNVWARRWLPLGQYASRGRGLFVRLRAEAPGALVADALRATAVPDASAPR